LVVCPAATSHSKDEQTQTSGEPVQVLIPPPTGSTGHLRMLACPSASRKQYPFGCDGRRSRRVESGCEVEQSTTTARLDTFQHATSSPNTTCSTSGEPVDDQDIGCSHGGGKALGNPPPTNLRNAPHRLDRTSSSTVRSPARWPCPGPSCPSDKANVISLHLPWLVSSKQTARFDNPGQRTPGCRPDGTADPACSPALIESSANK
jgi:hypothetical protein